MSVQDGTASMPLAGPVLGSALLATIIRYYLNRRICGARLLKPAPVTPKAHMLEEAWLFCCSAVLLALSTWATLHNGQCSLVDTSGCFADWRRQTHSHQQQLAYSITIGWYLHCILKSLLPGIGLHAGVDMVAHHLVTVVAFAASYIFELQRIGMLLLAVLNFSNPFMHFSKVLHYGGAGQRSKVACFAVFGAAFFISRLVLFPVLIYWNGIRALLQNLSAGSIGPGLVCLSLVTFLQVLQVYWFHRILRVLANGKPDKPPSKPPSKRGDQAEDSATLNAPSAEEPFGEGASARDLDSAAATPGAASRNASENGSDRTLENGGPCGHAASVTDSAFDLSGARQRKRDFDGDSTHELPFVGAPGRKLD